MTDTLTGLAAIRAYQEQKKKEAAERDRPKATWFKWPKDGTTVAHFQFLQELDESAPGYSEVNGLGTAKVEHQAPGEKGYLRRANCTLESEGECYACERHAQDRKEGWGQKTNFYINVLVRFKDEAPVPMVISRNAGSTFFESLVEEAVDEGSITNAVYKVTKTGSGKQTAWLLKRTKDEPFDTTGIEVFDLEQTVFRAIPYEKQAEYYGAVYQGAAVAAGDLDAAGSTSVDADW